MPKLKWNLNTIYISERLQESLRPISRCVLTTVVAPMGYGKTTAVNWYLEQRAKVQSRVLFASACILTTLQSSGKAYRMPLPVRALTSCWTIPAPQTPPAGDYWQTISAMNWQAKLTATSLLMIFTC